MAVITARAADRHDLHGATFRSYVRPGSGSTQLCAWRLDLPAGTTGVAHVVSHEEVLLVLGGSLLVHLDGVAARAGVGDVVHVPAGSELGADNRGDEPAAAWVTTSVGLEAVLADGSRLRPPWTR